MTLPFLERTTPVVEDDPVSDKIITAEELYTLSSRIGRAELVEGRVKRIMPTGYPHGFIEALIAALLFAFVRQQRLGYVLTGEAGVFMRRNPDTVRGVDVAFISNARYAQVQSHSYLDVCPELIVEIMSPDDTWSEVHTKLAECFAIHAVLVWVVDPRLAQIHVYRSLDDITRLTKEDTLTGEDVLPGFSVVVSEIFADPAQV